MKQKIILHVSVAQPLTWRRGKVKRTHYGNAWVQSAIVYQTKHARSSALTHVTYIPNILLKFLYFRYSETQSSSKFLLITGRSAVRTLLATSKPIFNLRNLQYIYNTDSQCKEYTVFARVFCAPQFLKDDFGFIFAPRISRSIVLFIYQ
jgi:hypothetical protein